MLTDSTSPSKDTVWKTELKRKIQQYLIYRRPHLIDRNKHWLRVKGQIYQANGPLGVEILISDKVDIKLTLVNEIKKNISY
jgi:hypothetical protein